MRVLVCGGRDFTNREAAYSALDALHVRYPVTWVIHGAARGADTLAGEWAKSRGIQVFAFVARWDQEGNAAGMLRNQRMLTYGAPDYVVAFPGGRGTADMVHRAALKGLPIWHVPG